MKVNAFPFQTSWRDFGLVALVVLLLAFPSHALSSGKG